MNFAVKSRIRGCDSLLRARGFWTFGHREQLGERRMRRLSLVKLFMAAGCLAIGLGAAPATPSYHGVERAIDEIRQSWVKPGAPAQPNAPGWNAFFDAMVGELHKFGEAPNENERLVSLNRLYKMWVALEVTPWA